MPYSEFDLEDGKGSRGYAVKGECLDCDEPIDKGLAFLCYCCLDYFCETHLTIAFDGDGEPIEFRSRMGESMQCCRRCKYLAEENRNTFETEDDDG